MNTRRVFVVLAVLALAMMMAGPGFAQTGTPTPTFLSVDSSSFPTVLLRLNIVDSSGRPVTGLSPSAFQVLEDGHPAEISSVKDVADDSQAAAVVIAIDTSDSMANGPLTAAKLSADAFLNKLGAGDQVAVLSFGSAAHEVQPFTVDKALARKAIESLEVSGTTALYDAANQAVLTAARSTLSRRVVILLTDGAEYGGASLSAREDAYKAARSNGVSIDTIAFGFNADTDYLQQLSGLTGGVALKAPSQAELDSRWTDISALLHQSVEIRIRSTVPGDGRAHALTLKVRLSEGESEASTTFQSRAVSPVIELTGLGPTLNQPVSVIARVAAQGAVAKVSFDLDGRLLAEQVSAPYTIQLDPTVLKAGTHTLLVNAVDVAGISTEKSIQFNVAAAPPKVHLALQEGQQITAPLSVVPEIVSQSDTYRVVVAIDGAVVKTLETAPYRFTLDPADIKAGAHILTLTVTDGQGQTAAAQVGFTIVSPVQAPVSLPVWLVGGIAVLAVVLATGIIIRRSRGVRSGSAPAYRLEVTLGPDRGAVLAVSDEKRLIGRLSSAALSLKDPTGGLHLSREHARVWRTEAGAFIEDAGSRYGTYVDGQKASGPMLLADGARIRLGEIEMIYRGPAVAAGDMRATRLDRGMSQTLLVSNTPAEDSFANVPAVSQGLAAEIDAESRKTRLKSEALQKSPEQPEPDMAGPDSTRQQTGGKAETDHEQPAGPDLIDSDELRRTRLKRENDPLDDESRRTKRRED